MRKVPDRGECSLCGETGPLFIGRNLPEDLEGVACKRCCESTDEEAEHREHIEYEQQQDRSDIDERW